MENPVIRVSSAACRRPVELGVKPHADRRASERYQVIVLARRGERPKLAEPARNTRPLTMRMRLRLRLGRSVKPKVRLVLPYCCQTRPLSRANPPLGAVVRSRHGALWCSYKTKVEGSTSNSLLRPRCLSLWAGRLIQMGKRTGGRVDGQKART